MTIDRLSANVKRKTWGKETSFNTGWDIAIADAREKIKALEFSIGVFEQYKREGRKWPKKTGTKKGNSVLFLLHRF